MSHGSGNVLEGSLGRSLMVNTDQRQREQVVRIAKALGSEQRLRILEFLTTRVANVSEISQALEMPLSTVNLHLTTLENAGLVRSEMVSATRGLQKMCARVFDIIVLHLPRASASPETQSARVEMPVGGYVHHEAVPPCGLVGADSVIGHLDDLTAFYLPDRFNAQLVWLGSGFLEYRFPHDQQMAQKVSSLQISMELCSEAAPHHPQWPSDIFLEINDILIGIWTSPGDFGGERGRFTPGWWENWNSQYGILKTWRVDQEDSTIDGRLLSEITVDQLKLEEQPYIKVRIGVNANAVNVGGMNLFGRRFGNHAQDIVLELHY